MTLMSDKIRALDLWRVSSTGIDLISLGRLSKVLKRSPNLLRALCQESERSHRCHHEGAGLIWASMLWTCKEAAVKCIGTGFWRQGVEWRDVCIHAPFPVESPERILEVRSVKVTLSGVAADLCSTVHIEGTFELIDPPSYGRSDQRNDSPPHLRSMNEYIALARMELYRPLTVPSSRVNQ